MPGWLCLAGCAWLAVPGWPCLAGRAWLALPACLWSIFRSLRSGSPVPRARALSLTQHRVLLSRTAAVGALCALLRYLRRGHHPGHPQPHRARRRRACDRAARPGIRAHPPASGCAHVLLAPAAPRLAQATRIRAHPRRTPTRATHRRPLHVWRVPETAESRLDRAMDTWSMRVSGGARRHSEGGGALCRRRQWRGGCGHKRRGSQRSPLSARRTAGGPKWLSCGANALCCWQGTISSGRGPATWIGS